MSIYDTIKNNPNYNIKNSWSWFNTNVKLLAKSEGVTSRTMMSDNQTQQVARISPGHLYMFFYDPIHKDTLPFYDTFPLIVPFSMRGRYFLGLNFHYLSPKWRLKLLDKLLNYVTDDTLSDKAKMMLSWRMLRNASKFPEIAPCVKMYEKSHVKSKFLKIPPSAWVISLFLPVSKFVGIKEEQLWKKTTPRIRGR